MKSYSEITVTLRMKRYTIYHLPLTCNLLCLGCQKEKLNFVFLFTIWSIIILIGDEFYFKFIIKSKLSQSVKLISIEIGQLWLSE